VTDFLQNHPEGVILTLDQMTLYFQATTTRVWAPIGQTPVIHVTPQRDHVHFYGALNVRTGQEVVLTLPDQSTPTTVHFLAHVLACFPTQPILLLLDRAPWHHGPALVDFLAQHPRLELLYFPPACPDLNPQEHVWEQARDAISHNHTFTDFARLRAAFTAFLENTLFPLDWLEHYAPASLYVV
jgi:transposase